MDLLFTFLKGQVSTLNFILFLSILALLSYKIKRRKLAIALSVFATLCFTLSSTAYLPTYLVKRLESQYVPFDTSKFIHKGRTVFIHVLGGGYHSNEKLPAQAQLSLNALGRLAEGIRISRSLSENTLVFSGNKTSGTKSLAFISKQAAFLMGVDSSKIEILENPATTMEEAIAFKKRFGTDVSLIIVTDALHMPRAMKFFASQNLKPYPAPTNYLIASDSILLHLAWLPSLGNMLNMDRVIHELFGQLKEKIFN